MTKYENLECFRKLTGETSFQLGPISSQHHGLINEAYHQGATDMIHFR